MRFLKLIFPLTVDFGSDGYWINDDGPFPYGAAVTEFFCGDDLADNMGDSLLLMRRLEELLQAFGGHLHPYAQEREVSRGPFTCWRKWPWKVPSVLYPDPLIGAEMRWRNGGRCPV